MQRRPLEKNDKPSQSYVKICLNDYTNYGHLTYKDQVSKIAGKTHFHKLSFGVSTFRTVGYQMPGQSFSAWEMWAHLLESHWCCLLQLPSVDFLKSSPCIPLSTAHELKTTGLMRLKFKHKIMNVNEKSSHLFISFFPHCINISRHLIKLRFNTFRTSQFKIYLVLIIAN